MTAAEPGHGSEAAAPAFSVIVPVFRDWQALEGLLAALQGQALPPEAGPGSAVFDLVLVDNDPASGVPTELAARLREMPFAVSLCECDQPGSYAARNRGAGVARGRDLVFTDADCRPAPGWLAAYRAARLSDADALLAGPVRMTVSQNPGIWEIYDAVRGIPQERFVAHGYGATANLCVPARALRSLGGFDATRFSGGDAEFCRRARRAGWRLHLVAGAVAFHPARRDRAVIETKARRIKGGQIRSGSRLSRSLWAVRSLSPPLREIVAYLRDGRHPLRWRWLASAIRLRLWLTELAEMGRLLRGSPPERR